MSPITVFSSTAETLWLCLFDGERETDRIPLAPLGAQRLKGFAEPVPLYEVVWR